MFSTHFRPGDRVRALVTAQALREGTEYAVTALHRQPFGVVLYVFDGVLVVANAPLLLSRVSRTEAEG